MTGFVLEARLMGANNLIGIGIDSQGKNVANDRKVVRMLLRNGQPIDEHHDSLSIPE
ncbi:hypothetical protein D3C81_1342230 [compost metagenome]